MNPLAGHVASLLPPRSDLTDDELIELADSVIGVALRITGILRDEDPKAAGELVDGLTDDRRWALPFVAAAMVDYDKTPRAMLEWAAVCVPQRLTGATAVSPPAMLLRSQVRRTRYAACGTDKAWHLHMDRGEEPCDVDWIAHRAWENDKKAEQRNRGRRNGQAALPGLETASHAA
jgi:hypothetical protein